MLINNNNSVHSQSTIREFRAKRRESTTTPANSHLFRSNGSNGGAEILLNARQGKERAICDIEMNSHENATALQFDCQTKRQSVT